MNGTNSMNVTEEFVPYSHYHVVECCFLAQIL